MKLIVGLGNPGEEYRGTRHNVGFWVVEEMIRRVKGEKVGGERWWLGELWRWEEILLLKPMTFMNKSGESVRRVGRFYKVKSQDLWVVHDDLDIKLGKYKIQRGVGPKGHKGVLSVEREWGEKDFWRVRVGVENRKKEERLQGEEYVLGRFRGEEREVIEKMVGEVGEELERRLG